MPNTPTPHNAAKEGEIAKTVLMPGDPLRAKFIAETYLTDAVCFNQVRNMLGFTGTYQGKRVSVMGGGMGIPSVGIYTYELFHFYGVESVIRIGSAGMLSQSLKLRDIVAGVSCYTNSNFGAQYGFQGNVAPCCSWTLLKAAMEAGERVGQIPVPGPIYSSDIFYDQSGNGAALEQLGVLAVEMEAAALYLNAARAGKNALCLCTISDNPKTGEELTAEERQNTFTKMMEIALEIA